MAYTGDARRGVHVSKSNGISGLKFGIADALANSFVLGGTDVVGPLVAAPLNEVFNSQRTGTVFNNLQYQNDGDETDAIGFYWLCPRAGWAMGRVRTAFSWAVNTASPGTAAPIIEVTRIRFLPSAKAEERTIEKVELTQYQGSIQPLTAGNKVDIQTDPAVLGLFSPLTPAKPFPLEMKEGDLVIVGVRIRIIDAAGGGTLEAVLNHTSPQDPSNHFLVSFGPTADSSTSGNVFP
jgi:hypothetical protein